MSHGYEQEMLHDGPLTLRSAMDGWWAIEKRDHENRKQMRQGDGYVYLWCSARISDADVEGDAAEMLSVADAIQERGSFHAKRCSVAVDGERVYFASPRNSQAAAVVPLAHADALAAEIRQKVGTVANPGGGK